MTEALIASLVIMLTALSGIFFFRNDKRLVGIERFTIPVAVGVFLSFVLLDLIPETLGASEFWGGIVIAGGFVGFYVLSNILHQRLHDVDPENCDRKSAALLLLGGNTIHHIADGIVLGGAFLIDPAAGIATALALALHEVPQEIVQFGVLLRAGYTRLGALLYNLLSSSGIVIGTLLVVVVTGYGADYVWILTGLAAGNLLYLAASDLLPRIHGNLPNYGIWHSTAAIIIGFTLMSLILSWTHRHEQIQEPKADSFHFIPQ